MKRWSEGVASGFRRISNLESILNELSCLSASDLNSHAFTLVNLVVIICTTSLILHLHRLHFRLQARHQLLQSHHHHYDAFAFNFSLERERESAKRDIRCSCFIKDYQYMILGLFIAEGLCFLGLAILSPESQRPGDSSSPRKKIVSGQIHFNLW